MAGALFEKDRLHAALEVVVAQRLRPRAAIRSSTLERIASPSPERCCNTLAHTIQRLAR